MEEINLYDLLRYYARNWLNLISALLIGAIIGVLYTGFIQTPLYKSEATMLVVSSGASQDTTINNNYTELFKSRLVLQNVIDTEDYKGDYSQLLGRTTATNDKDTDILKVSIADPDSAKSQKLLAAAVDGFKEEATKIYEASNITTVDTANLPNKSYNVNIPVQIGLAMAATFFVAIIILFFVYDYVTSYKATQPASKGTSTTKKTKAVATKSATAETTTSKAASSKQQVQQVSAKKTKPTAKKKTSTK